MREPSGFYKIEERQENNTEASVVKAQSVTEKKREDKASWEDVETEGEVMWR